MLAEQILAFISKARQSPAFASDPVLLDALEKEARLSTDGSVAALHAPVASETWEARSVMLGAAQSSDRVPMRIPYEVTIVGFQPFVTSLGGGGAVPTLSDIDVSVDLDNKEVLTSARGVTVPGSTIRDGTFVTLASLSVQTPRLIWLLLDQKTTDMGVTFRWKRGAGVYQDTLITLSMFVRPLRRGLTGTVR